MILQENKKKIDEVHGANFLFHIDITYGGLAACSQSTRIIESEFFWFFYFPSTFAYKNNDNFSAL
jgi:hypothetical protein